MITEGVRPALPSWVGTPDATGALLLFGGALALLATYAVRTLTTGRARFDRVDRDGGSALLHKGVMEVAYWSLQPLARTLISLRISADAVSWASLVLGCLAGVALALGHFGLGALLAAVAALLDSVDGIVARGSRTASEAGEVLDAAVDRCVEFAFLAGLAVYYRQIPALLVLVLLALLGSFLVSYATAKAEALGVAAPRGSMRRAERATYLILGAALTAISVPALEVSHPTPVAVGYPMVATLGLVAVFANLSAVARLCAIARAVAERR